MPYLDENGNEIASPKQKVYLDDAGNPLSAEAAPGPSAVDTVLGASGRLGDRLLGSVIPGEAGKRLAANESTGGQELAKAFVPSYDAPATPTEIATGIVQPHLGLAMLAGGLPHGRAVQKAAVEFAGDTARDPLTYGALGALKKLGLVGKGLTAGANALFALKAGEAVPGEFAEAKRIYDERGFVPEVTEAIAKGVLLGGAAGLGARGTIKEGAQFGREAKVAGGRAVRGAAEVVAKVPQEAAIGLGATGGASLGGLLTSGLGGFGQIPGALAGGKVGAMLHALAQRLAAQKAGVPTEVVDVPAPADLAPGETLRPVQPRPAPKPYVPEFSPEALGLEPLDTATTMPQVLARRAAPPVEAPGPAIPVEAEAVGSQAAQAPRGRTIQEALDEMRAKGSEPPKPPDWTAEDQALSEAATAAERARLVEKDAIVRAYEARLKADAPGAKPATIKAAERAQKAAQEATTLTETLMARVENPSQWNPEYPQWSPTATAHERWLNTAPEPQVVGITPPRAGHVPVGAEVFPRRPGGLPPAAPEAAPPAAPVEILPEGQRAMPGGRGGEAQSPATPLKGLDTPEKVAAAQQLQELLAAMVEQAPKKAKKPRLKLKAGKLVTE